MNIECTRLTLDLFVAVRVVAGEGVHSITEEEVYDVMLAMGYTFQEDDIVE